MRTILLIGAGKSTSHLLKFLIEKANAEKLHILVGDINLDNAKSLLKEQPNCTAIKLDIFNEEERKNAIKKAGEKHLLFCYHHLLLRGNL